MRFIFGPSERESHVIDNEGNLMFSLYLSEQEFKDGIEEIEQWLKEHPRKDSGNEGDI